MLILYGCLIHQYAYLALLDQPKCPHTHTHTYGASEDSDLALELLNMEYGLDCSVNSNLCPAYKHPGTMPARDNASQNSCRPCMSCPVYGHPTGGEERLPYMTRP